LNELKQGLIPSINNIEEIAEERYDFLVVSIPSIVKCEPGMEVETVARPETQHSPEHDKGIYSKTTVG